MNEIDNTTLAVYVYGAVIFIILGIGSRKYLEFACITVIYLFIIFIIEIVERYY